MTPAQIRLELYKKALARWEAAMVRERDESPPVLRWRARLAMEVLRSEAVVKREKAGAA